MELQKATIEDANLLFAYRNEEETRRNSKTQELISWENHIKWLTVKLESPDCLLFLAKQGKTPVGQIRLDIQEQKAIISYSIDKQYRGQGYGKAMLKEVEAILQNDKTIILLEAEVKSFNQASQKCFISLGYQLEENSGDILIYRKSL